MVSIPCTILTPALVVSCLVPIQSQTTLPPRHLHLQAIRPTRIINHLNMELHVMVLINQMVVTLSTFPMAILPCTQQLRLDITRVQMVS